MKYGVDEFKCWSNMVFSKDPTSSRHVHTNVGLVWCFIKIQVVQGMSIQVLI
jgi:hypothetical protein